MGAAIASRPDRVALAVVVVAAFVLVMLLLLLFAAFIFGGILRYDAAVWIDTSSMRRALRELSPDILRSVFLYVRDKTGVRLTHFTTHGTSSDFVLFEQIAAKGLVGCGGGNVSVVSFFNRLEPRVGCARRCYSLPAATKYHQLRCFYGATFFAVCFVVGDIVVVGVGAADVVSAFAAGVAFAVAAEMLLHLVVVAFAVEASNNVVDEWRSAEFVMVANSSCCCYRTDRSLYSYLSSRSSFSFSLCYCRS